MRIGVVFPTTEIGDDPIAIKDYAQAAEALGYHHLLTFDHVLGANMASRPGWKGFYDHTQGFTSRSCCSASWRRWCRRWSW